jgi:two-component system chemotaxis response regulator CheY
MDTISISDLSILIVEPSMTSTRYIEEQLKSLDVRNIEHCGSGAEALEIMRKSPPDLVASSMYLPDMTATQLIETMRNDPKLEHISFMLVSTETSFAKLDPIRQAGIVAILPKPFSCADLRKALVGTTRFLEHGEAGIEQEDLEDLKVLVVDDSPMARKHIIRVLSNLGIEKITEAENGREAVDILERDFFDLVFTDYNMPEMDGEKLTRYIREKSTQRSIPILMVTSEENGSRLAAVQQAGVSGICDKPFDTDTILALIQNIRAEERQQS